MSVQGEPKPDGGDPIDITVPQSPRVWNYWLGGKDNYEVDRAVGDAIMASTPEIVEMARSSRAFLIRAIEHLAGPAGIRQFLDVGTGLPVADNTHEIAQRVAPDARVVYVDNDPVVLAHARALLHGVSPELTAFLDADLYQPAEILARAGELLDFSRPGALIFLNVLCHVEDQQQATSIVRTLFEPFPPGSYLVVSDSTNVIQPEAVEEAARIYNENSSPKVYLRSPEQLADFFDGLELLEPGLVSCPAWRPVGPERKIVEVDEFCGVARKPG